MCTAITFGKNNSYFGRTLDYEFSYGEEVTFTPRAFRFNFRHMGEMKEHYAILGMAHVSDEGGEYPLYYDAMNEAGLCMAGLSFPSFSVYSENLDDNLYNIASYELLPFLLGQCKTVREARDLLGRINLTGEPFSEKLPVAPLHWLLADRESAMTLEFVNEGMKIYENPVGVLTNAPPFDMQMLNLSNYRGLSASPSVLNIVEGVSLPEYSRGMGAIGLPGDLSSQSRFVRASFTKANAVVRESEVENVGQLFHVLDSVAQTLGCCRLPDGKLEFTIYTSCHSIEKGIYYYTTYGNRSITAVDMHKENMDGEVLVRYPLVSGEQIREMVQENMPCT